MCAALEALAKAAAAALAADAAAILLLDEAQARLVVVAADGLPAGFLPAIPAAGSAGLLIREVWTHGHAVVADSAADSLAAGHGGEAALPDASTSQASFPLLFSPFVATLYARVGSADRPWGMVCVHSLRPRQFALAEVATLEALADVGAAVLQSTQRLADLERVEASQSQFVRVATHELRSPVTVAQSLIRNVLKGYAGSLSEKQRDVFERISRQLDSLETLVNDLLDLAASRTPGLAGEVEPVAINPSVGRAVLLLQPRADEKGVALVLRPCRNELVVCATEEGLDRIFVNLVGNAIKYTPAGGEVTVLPCGSGGEVSVAVTDTGIGIPPEALPHLFEEFYRAPNARAAKITGTGLGLAIVKELVDRYGGRIEVESKLGEGSTFTVTLPACQPT